MSSETLYAEAASAATVRARDLPVASKVLIALRHPYRAANVVVAIARGASFRLWCRLFRPRVEIAPGLRLYGRLIIRGPGRVTIGRNVEVHGRVTPWTNERDAHISIGDETTLDGTRFGCVRRIAVGSHCLLSTARVLDSSFHSLDRHSARLDIFTAPVTIHDGVWLSPDCAILPGTEIGAYSVVSLGAICKGQYPDHSLLFGNPARVAAKLPTG